eukprot:6717445-Prymnesium_polylepis.1
MVDEADKAPLEVVCVLKALVEDGELTLGDGRRLLTPMPGVAAAGATDGDVVWVHRDFRVVVLANRPGFPFLGNDFFRECGDVFAAHAIEPLDLPSELALLRAYAPLTPLPSIVDLALLFGELRAMADGGSLSYPYSTRELVKLALHLEAFPADGVA